MPSLVRLRRHWPLLPPLLLSAVLSSWALGTVGWGNTYYSSAVRSMSSSWHAFWYGALDSVGFVTVDKPPFSLWVQALSARLFGFSSMSLLVPQVIAGVAAVALVYATVVRRWGRLAAAAGAMALAVTPISVMVNHSNNTDAILTLAMTATAWAGVRAVETGRWRWVTVTAVLFGVSFTTKMLAAAPVLPAVLVAFALGDAVAPRRRAVMLAAGTALAVVTALTWFTVVDLTPATARPYVGSSTGNSAYQLAFERNGVNQVEGEDPTSGGGRGPGGGSGGGPGGATGFSGGESGALRLFNAELGTQIGWLVLPGLAGAAAASVLARRRRPWLEPTLVVPVVWFAGGAAAYSVTEGIVHPYYVASIVPPLAMLVGAGIGALRRTEHRIRGSLATGIAVAACGMASWMIARRETWTIATRCSMVAAVVGVALTAFVVVARARMPRSVLLGAVATVLLAPLAWTVGSLKSGLSANLPYANPTAAGAGFARPGGGAPGSQFDSSVVEWLQGHRGDTDWLVATSSAMTAGPIIIATGEPVMALGGFSGNDEILDADSFDALVAEGRVRYVLLGSGGGPGGPGGGRLTSHITSTCAPVTEVSSGLYDCAA